MPYQPKEAELLQLGFRTNSPAQPYPTRAYFAPMQGSDNYLTLCPRPGMETAVEFTGASKVVARYYIRSADDLRAALRGEGQREALPKHGRALYHS
ncbi:hypothetical protein [Hymenobacter mucosus]|uniref:Uncharacterized protein n=1 Tax=Hymenobacter mucosus TaxID=1411120 RepID=A0A239A989_9BACT|nr:hypothetical protein [Hymenobacter mucosus]SNR92079.1 hypothetical protein SAMN06269173_11174 [Hymenobacter mucosus]